MATSLPIMLAGYLLKAAAQRLDEIELALVDLGGCERAAVVRAHRDRVRAAYCEIVLLALEPAEGSA